jgi:tight adherence protein B
MALQLALLCAFIALFAGLEALFHLWQSRGSARARARLRRLKNLHTPQMEAPPVLKRDRIKGSRPRLAAFVGWIEQSGIAIAPLTVLRAVGALALGVMLLALMFGAGGALAVLSGVLAALLPLALIARLRARRLARFEAQLPDTLDLITRALRAGHALQSALQMAATECPSPSGEVFARVCDEIRFGLSTPQALNNLAQRMPLADVKFFVIALLIARETGGNLSQVLMTISALMRSRVKLIARLRALAAEGLFSGVVLWLLPFATGALLYFIDPQFMSLLWQDEGGRNLMKGAFVMMLLGAVWMRQIVRIRV